MIISAILDCEVLLFFMFLIRKLLGFPLNKFDYTLENTTCIISV